VSPRAGGRLLAAWFACLAATACTNDYAAVAPSSGAGGTGGAAASTSTASAGGMGGGSTASASSSTASQGGGGANAGGGGGGCANDQKLCGSVCVSVDDPAYGCDAAGCAPCEAPHTQAACAQGACAIAACDAPFDDCNGQYADGCEANLSSDSGNCGSCGVACASGACTASACTFCGDGKVDPGEQCDKGDLVPGDGCSPTCHVENPDDCPGTAIPLGPGMFVISGDTTGANDTMQDTGGAGVCVGSYPGGDYIYAVTPSVGGTLIATLTASFIDHFLRARVACPAGQVLDCDYSGSSSTSDVISFAVTAGQTYYVVVDSYTSKAGSFSLQLQL